MAIRYRRYRASNFRLGRQASIRELELTAAIVLVALLTYFATRVNTVTLWVIFISIVLLGLIIGTIFFTIFQRSWKRNMRAMQVLGVIDIDKMSKDHFENYIETLLQALNYQTMQVSHASMNDARFIAQKGKKTLSVHLIRQEEPVHAALVHRALIQRAQNGYDATLIITTTTFTPAARRLAVSRHCVLIDRQRLARWVLDFQEGN